MLEYTKGTNYSNTEVQRLLGITLGEIDVLLEGFNWRKEFLRSNKADNIP